MLAARALALLGSRAATLRVWLHVPRRRRSCSSPLLPHLSPSLPNEQQWASPSSPPPPASRASRCVSRLALELELHAVRRNLGADLRLGSLQAHLTHVSYIEGLVCRFSSHGPLSGRTTHAGRTTLPSTRGAQPSTGAAALAPAYMMNYASVRVSEAGLDSPPIRRRQLPFFQAN